MPSEVIKNPNPVAEGLSLYQATDRISEIMRGGPAPAAPETVADPAPVVRAPAADPQELKEDPDVEVVDETPEVGAPDTEEVTSDAEAEKPEETGDTPSEEAENTEIELDQSVLAQFLGVDEDDLILGEEGDLSIRTKVDGKAAHVTVKDLKDSYQLAKASQARMQSLAEERKDFETKRSASLKDLEVQQQYMATAIQAVEQQYAQDWQNIDWHRLRMDDQEGYAVRRQEFDDRMRQVSGFKQQFTDVYKKTQDEMANRRKEAWSDGFRKLNDVFTSGKYSKTPKWEESEKTRLAEWMVGQGMPAESLGEVDNWLVFKWARDSMLRDAENEAAAKTAKRVVRLPKVKAAKPGAKKNERQVGRRTDIEEAKIRQRKAAKPGNQPGSRRSNLKETTALIEKIIRS